MWVVCVLVDVHVVDVVTGVTPEGSLPGLAGVAAKVRPGPCSWARQGVRGRVQRVLQLLPSKQKKWFMQANSAANTAIS